MSSRVQMDTDAAPLVMKYCFKKCRVFPESRISSITTRWRPVISCWMSWVICTIPELLVELP